MGQTQPISGRVQLKADDGTLTPVENAKVDCYRTDADLSCRSTTTAKDGTFSILGIPLNGTVALAVSAPGMNPTVFPGIRPGQENIEIHVSAGDGSVIDAAETRRLAALWATNPTGELTEEQKKAQEEYEKQKAEYEARKAEADKNNNTWDRVLKEGNEAFTSGNYDIALAKFQEGIDVDPEYIGSAPAFYNNKAAVLKKRAAEVYNAGVKSQDPGQIAEASKKASADLSAALENFGKSYDLLINASPQEIPDQANYKQNLFSAADGGRDVVRIMLIIKAVDAEKIGTAKKLVEEYFRLETDKKKQGDALASLASYLFTSGDMEGAVNAYKKAYEFSPKDPEILGMLSLALYTEWDINRDDSLQQETVKFIEEYLANAPKDHKFRDDLGCTANLLLKRKKYPCSQDQ